jgi:hypothetical protein
MSEYESQCDAILAHLHTEGPINPMQALGLYGCFRLAARILDLRKRGHRIETRKRVTPNGTRFAEYVMG